MQTNRPTPAQSQPDELTRARYRAAKTVADARDALLALEEFETDDELKALVIENADDLHVLAAQLRDAIDRDRDPCDHRSADGLPLPTMRDRDGSEEA